MESFMYVLIQRPQHVARIYDSNSRGGGGEGGGVCCLAEPLHMLMCSESHCTDSGRAAHYSSTSCQLPWRQLSSTRSPQGLKSKRKAGTPGSCPAGQDRRADVTPLPSVDYTVQRVVGKHTAD